MFYRFAFWNFTFLFLAHLFRCVKVLYPSSCRRGEQWGDHHLQGLPVRFFCLRNCEWSCPCASSRDHPPSWSKAPSQDSHSLLCQVSSSSWQRHSLAVPCLARRASQRRPSPRLLAQGSVSGDVPQRSRTFTWPFSCLPELPGSTTIKGYIHRAKTDACHFRSVSPGFRSSTGSSAATQTGSFPQPLMLLQQSCSALWRVRDGLGYVGNTGGSWRLSIWHSLEQDSK